MTQLRVELRVAGLEHPHQWAVGERATDRLHFRELRAAPEDVEKTRRLLLESTELPQLVEHNAPGANGKEYEDEENAFGERRRARDEFEDASTQTFI